MRVYMDQESDLDPIGIGSIDNLPKALFPYKTSFPCSSISQLKKMI